MSTFHIPVLRKEALAGLKVCRGEKYIDATIGGGGEGLEIIREGGDLLGIDLDAEALAFSRRKLEIESQKLEKIGNWKLVQGNFRNIEKIAKENGFSQVSGILFDLGLSSHQLDTADQGFSYRFVNTTLDLRFDESQAETAADLIKHLSAEELYEILAKFGEEKRARAIAEALVRARHLAPINKVSDVVKIVVELVPRREQKATLSRLFQALRIAVNDELGALREGLAGGEKLLKSGGRLVVISFHSLEDRIVKQFMRGGAWKMVTKKPLVASRREIVENIRARSAKLRVAEKL